MKMRLIVSVCLCCTMCLACNSDTHQNIEADRMAILRLHNSQRTCHFEHLAENFAEMLSDSFISVNRGEITRPSHEENTSRFDKYFNAVTFQQWDDKTPPVIRFSNDGSMAYTIVDKDVVVFYLSETDELVYEKTEFAWVAIYKKYADGWKIDCVSSTNKESEVLELESM